MDKDLLICVISGTANKLPRIFWHMTTSSFNVEEKAQNVKTIWESRLFYNSTLTWTGSDLKIVAGPMNAVMYVMSNFHA